jgi:predicted transcriptional regulator
MMMNNIQSLQNELKVLKAKAQPEPTTTTPTMMEQLTALQNQMIPKTPAGKGKRGGIVQEVPVLPFSNMNGLLGAGLIQSPAYGGVPRTRCIWVTGLPEEFVDADILCNIFGNYGNVMRINFSSKKPDGALIEMDEPGRAENCVRYLNNVRINGKRIMVGYSKIEKIEHVGKDGKSKDFSNARVNRFNKDRNTKQDSKFTRILMKRLSEPTPIVLVSNMPEGKAGELKKYLVDSGFTVKDIEEGKSRKARDTEEGKKQPKAEEETATARKTDMAFVEFASTEEAVKAVAKLHRTKPSSMGDWSLYTRGINLSFSNKRDLRQA